MKQKYEFSVRMQQRHLKAIVGSAAQALPSGHGSGLGGKRCLQDTGAGLGGKHCLQDTGAGLVASAAFRTRERPWRASAAFRTRTRASRLDWR